MLEVFGHRYTIAVGTFGVITVIGSKASGNVEVATYRSDAEYIDGRRPVAVTFCSAQDALRRDFTINGLFFDPIEEVVVDYVEGQRTIWKKGLFVPSVTQACDSERIIFGCCELYVFQPTLNSHWNLIRGMPSTGWLINLH